MSRRRTGGPLLVAALLTVAAPPSWAADPRADVVTRWSDGLSEVAVYDASLSRYGERRDYREVQILVKERFDARRMVKTDHPGSSPEQEFEVLKSARVLHFVTGVYDYHQALTYFAPIWKSPLAGSPPGPISPAIALGEHPAKLTLSSFEWCGTFFTEWRAEPGALVERSFSYFDGEADSERREAPPKGPWLAEDGWPVWARGLSGYGHRGPTKVRVLTSALRARFDHAPVTWEDGTLTVADKGDVAVVTLKIGALRTWTIEVDRTSPTRVIRSWSSTDGQQGRLVKVDRVPYWGQHGVEHEALRQEWGLVDSADLRRRTPSK